MTTIDYDGWAKTYDRTRGASPSVLRVLVDALGSAEGRTLLDAGCGTGNFALPLRDAGFDVALTDYSPDMVRRAAAKLPGALALAADSQALPFADAAFDCEISVNVIGHVSDWGAFMSEARRVVRTGPFVLKTSTAETLKGNWIAEYIPGVVTQAPSHHYQPEEGIVVALRFAGFARVDIARIHYDDMLDGSLQAIKRFPEAFLDDERILNLAPMKRLSEEEMWAGVWAIRRDLKSGALAQVIARYQPAMDRYGDSTVFIAYP